MAHLLYRVTTTPTVPTSTSVSSGALTSTQIDGNFKSINDELINKAPLTGEGVSGTWNISVSGNAGTVTNGVVTNGTYADPSWITSLAGSKVTNAVLTNGSYADPSWITSLAGSKVTNAVLTNGSYSNPLWITSLSETKVLPTQTSNSGKFLTTNGTSTSWATIDAFPTQTSNSGKFLTTDGTSVSWATVDALPTQTGNSGKFLTTDGTSGSWSSITKTTVGLSNVENTALSTWAGTTNITTIGAATATSLTTSGNVTINGTLTVNGTTTTLNTNTLVVDDKNIELGSVVAIPNVSGTISSTATTTTITGITSTAGMIPGQALTRVSGAGAFGGTSKISSIDSATQITITSATANTAGAIVFNVGGATDQTAHLGGITLKGDTDKLFRWDVDTNAWSSSESIQLSTTKVFKIAGTEVLSSTTLGSGVTGSSLTSVGTLTTGTWNASVINPTYGGTGVNNGGRTITLNTGNLTLTAQSGGSSVTVPTSGTLATLAGTETLTNKTLTSPVISSISNTGTITLPTTTGTLALLGDTHYIGTTAVTLNRASANLALTGISSVTLPGSTSGTIQIIPTAVAGTGTVLTLPATTGTVITTGDTGTVTNGMLAGSIGNSKLSNSSITIGTTAISLGSSSTTLAGLTSVTSTSFTGGLTGNASTATALQTARTINGTSFDGSANITVTAAAGTLTGTSLNSTVTGSSLTSVGTIGTGTWQGSVVGLAYGGTNANLTAVNGGIIYSTASAMAVSAAGTTGQVLTSNGAAAPTWQTINTTINITDDTSTDATYYPSFQTSSSGTTSSVGISSSKLTYNPSTGTLSSVVFNSLSDENVKKNITKITNASSTISQIDGVEFNWKDNDKKSAGVIAQQIEKIIPHLVDENNGVKSVNYNGLIGYLVECIKEMNARIEELENGK